MGKKLSLRERLIYRMAFFHALRGEAVDLMTVSDEIKDKMASFRTYELEMMAAAVEAEWQRLLFSDAERDGWMRKAQCWLHEMLAVEMERRGVFNEDNEDVESADEG